MVSLENSTKHLKKLTATLFDVFREAGEKGTLSRPSHEARYGGKI